MRRLLQTRRRRLVAASGILGVGLMGSVGFGVPVQQAITSVSTFGPVLLLELIWRPGGRAGGARLAHVMMKMVQSGRGAVLYPRFLVRSLTGVAALLAGRKRPALRDEWRAHLAGESGHDPVTWPKVRQALGFVASAVQCRLADAADMAWRPADAVLSSRFLSNLLVWGPVTAVLVAIVHHDGRFGLVADVQDPVALGAFLYGAIRTGRWWRGVKPPEPKARRAEE